ncbi:MULTISPECIES: hypothetical protein [unclassified Butyrivibrio]|nr:MULTISPECIES: hypothetical protein [unclassified Butyrivibrio]SEL28953.1 hypothetical protein SAMN04487770_10883 [Butyrivibrio sp. ob235]
MVIKEIFGKVKIYQLHCLGWHNRNRTSGKENYSAMVIKNF